MLHEREKVYIYGKHALTEALKNSVRAVKKVFLAPEINDQELKNLLRKSGVAISALKSSDASRMVGRDVSHQGIIGIMNPEDLMVEFDDFKNNLGTQREAMLVLLDELTDPHNVGAIIRSAAAFGAAGVLIPSHRQAPITGAVVKASAGMVFKLPMVSIGNINFTIRELKEIGFTTYGLIMDGKESTDKSALTDKSLFIIGNEGEGIREKTLELCDIKLQIPMNSRAESLNASVSAAIVMYEWGTKHPQALK